MSPKKSRVAIRASMGTRENIDRLVEDLGMNSSEVITLAVERLYHDPELAQIEISGFRMLAKYGGKTIVNRISTLTIKQLGELQDRMKLNKREVIELAVNRLLQAEIQGAYHLTDV